VRCTGGHGRRGSTARQPLSPQHRAKYRPLIAGNGGTCWIGKYNRSRHIVDPEGRERNGGHSGPRRRALTSSSTINATPPDPVFRHRQKPQQKPRQPHRLGRANAGAAFDVSCLGPEPNGCGRRLLHNPPMGGAGVFASFHVRILRTHVVASSQHQRAIRHAGLGRETSAAGVHRVWSAASFPRLIGGPLH